MKKQIIIYSVIAAIAIVGLVLYFHYMPVWISISNIVAFIIGVGLAVFAIYLKNKYRRTK